MKNQVFEWRSLERRERKHASDWYLAVGIIALSIAATAAILHNILFAVLIVISAGALFLRTLQKPREVVYALTVRGIHIGKEFTLYSALESFWIDEREAEATLIIKPKSLVSPLLIIPLQDTNADALREHLSEILLETELREPLSKKIMEFLGF